MVKKVVIVGAGPSGVLLAHYLLDRGEQYQIELYDRLNDPRVVEFSNARTYSITLTERGMSALRQIAGLEAAVRAIGIELQGGVFHAQNGKTRETTRKKPFVALDRTQLVIALLQELTQKYNNRRLNLYFNHFCTKVDLAAKTITFRSPETDLTVNYDVLIGADGARSAVRSHLLNTERFEFEQKYAANSYKSIYLPCPEPDTHLDLTRLHTWRNKDGTVVLLLPQRNKSLSGVVLFPRQNTQVTDLATPEAVLQFFHQHFPEVGQLIPLSEAEAFLNRSIARILTTRCSHYHYEKSVLIIGDAAHAVPPSLAQGCNAALEDVAILNQLLDEYADEWESAIAQFTIRRKADAHALLELSNYSFPSNAKLLIEFLVREQLDKLLHRLFPDRFAPPFIEMAFESSVPYSKILQSHQGWISSVKKSNEPFIESS
mgnify:CR=1 FL=1